MRWGMSRSSTGGSSCRCHNNNRWSRAMPPWRWEPKPLTLKMTVNKEAGYRSIQPMSNSINFSSNSNSSNRITSRCGGVDSSIIYSMVVGRPWASTLDSSGAWVESLFRPLALTKTGFVYPPAMLLMRIAVIFVFTVGMI